MKKQQKLETFTCPLCSALAREQEYFLLETPRFVILPTKSKKGHHKRIMIISKDHNLKNGPIGRVGIELFTKFCIEYFDEEPTFALCEPKYATIPDHWHFIACDWFGEEDIKQLHYTPHRAIETKVRWKP